MKWRLWAAVLLILFATIPAAANYTENDLWIIEIIVNQELGNSQASDALIIDQQVFLPLTRVTSIMKISLDTDRERGVYSFTNPGNLAPIVIDWPNRSIQSNGEAPRTDQAMHMINGELFLPIELLGELVDADLKYVEQHLAIYLDTTHLEKKENKREDKTQLAQDKSKKDVPAFSISNINYRWTIEWEKSISQIKVINANPNPDEGDDGTGGGGGRDDEEEANSDDENPANPPSTSEEVVKEEEESYQTALQTDIKGTVYNWGYWFQGQFFKQSEGPFEAELSKYVLNYDMDHAHFYVGGLSALTEKELPLKKSTYNGVSLVSRVSPLFRMNGNVINVTGEAPKGTKVKLYVNNWFIKELVVKDDGQYIFTDVLLSCSEKTNEVKVWLKKPGGDIEEIYRYISVTDAILNKGEVNYLVQAGKLKSDDHTGNYLWNSIVYWGVTDSTTLGLSWYGEMDDDASSIEDLLAYNYNSIRLNQRFNDNWIAKGTLYNIFGSEEGQQNLGYNLNLDYKDANTQFGIEYHKQGRTFKNNEEIPYHLYRAYLIQNINPQSVLEGTAAYYQKIDNPSDRQQHYDISYKVSGGEKWDSKINFTRDYYDQDKDSWQNSISASLAYMIRPNLKLLQDVKYKTKWDRFLTKELGVSVEGVYEYKNHTLIAGIDWSTDLTEQRSRSAYSISWSKLWELGKNQHLSTGLGYEYLVADHQGEHIVPVSFRYNYILPNDAKLQLYYQGKWDTSAKKQEIDHKIGLQLEGAFNFFDGKIVSTSPHSNGNQVGIVSGIVFRDTNRNGQMDEGEVPLPGITVLLGRKRQVTDAEGKFYFKEIQHGVHLLGFEYSKLPIQLTPSTADKNVKVVANGEVKEILGLYVVGAADGTIVVKNLPKDLTLRGIKLVANPGGYAVYTDRQGYYYFDQLPPGEYQIQIDATTLPEWIVKEPIEPKTIRITEAGEYIDSVDFELHLIPELLKQPEEKVENIQVVTTPSAAETGTSSTETGAAGAETATPQESTTEPSAVTAEPATPTESATESKPAEEPSPSTTTEESPTTIEGMEDQLIEIEEDMLTIDLSQQSVTFNGEPIALNPFFLEEEKIWAPIRSIAKLFNCRVFWDPKNQMVYIVDHDKNILFDVQMGYAMVNGVQHPLEDGIKMINDFTFVTLDELKLLGLIVDVKDDILYIHREKQE